MADRPTEKFSVAALITGLLIAILSGSAHAFPLSRAARPIYAAVEERMTPRPGWADFCRDNACSMQRSMPRKISLGAKICNKLVEVRPTESRAELGQAP